MTYANIEDILTRHTDYSIMRLTKNDRVFGIRLFGVPSITKYAHLNKIRGLFNEDEVNVWYDNNREFVEINLK